MKETLVKETLEKETLVKETLVKETLVKGTLVKETRVKWKRLWHNHVKKRRLCNNGQIRESFSADMSTVDWSFHSNFGWKIHLR